MLNNTYEVNVMQLSLRHELQHRFNAMHVYCKLRYFIPHAMAKRISTMWEKVVHPIIYR